MSNYTYDPYAAAENPSVGVNDFWGQVRLNVWACALIKGTGKVPYDPQVHEKPNTAVDIEIIPLAEQNITNTKACERHMIAESVDWAKIVLPSIKALGKSLRDMNDSWVHVQVVSNGKTYEKNGQTRDETVFKFVALFANEADCRADYMKNNGGQTSANPVQPSQAAQPAQSSNGDGKKAALPFLEVIVKNASNRSTDLEGMRKDIAMEITKYPVVAKVFTVDSPETTELIMKYQLPF